MNEGLVPRRYAKALLKYASEKNCAPRLYDLMLNLEHSFVELPALNDSLANPYVSDADKTQLMLTAAGATDADTVYADFVRLLCQNRRIDMARRIALAYLDIYRHDNNIYVVNVESAAPLAPADEERIRNIVARHTNGGTIEYTSKINPSLIGGFTVTVGNDRIDASVSNELKQLRLNLLSK